MSSSGVGVLLVAVGGFLIGGVASLWRQSRALAGLIGLAAAIAIAAGVLRLV